MSDEQRQPPLRLDPDQAVAKAKRASADEGALVESGGRPGGTAAPAIDTRPYRWAIGALGIALVIVISVVLFLTRSLGSVGVAPGQRLHDFAAPVATSSLVGDPNLAKPCTLGYFGARAVNTCLLTRHEPLVLAFFVTGSSDCVREVDAVQRVSREFLARHVAFAAVAVRASKGETARLVRGHHWSVPVAYDRDGVLGAVYSVEICPLLELVGRGGVVKYRLIGNRWLNASALSAKVHALVG